MRKGESASEACLISESQVYEPLNCDNEHLNTHTVPQDARIAHSCRQGSDSLVPGLVNGVKRRGRTGVVLFRKPHLQDVGAPRW